MSKLMLLEYFRPEHFISLSDINSDVNGDKSKFEKFEKNIAKSTDNKDDSLTEFESWSKDSWLENWIRLDPAIGSIDLNPYFYFSRDSLRSQPMRAQRLSPEAQDIFMSLISGSKTMVSSSINQISKLGQGDSANILVALADKVISSDDKDTIGKLLIIQCDICIIKKELIGELFKFLERLPDSKIPIQLIPKLKGVIDQNKNYHDTLKTLFQHWSKGENKLLKSAIKKSL